MVSKTFSIFHVERGKQTKTAMPAGGVARHTRQYFTGGDADQRQLKVSGSKFQVNGQTANGSSKFRVQSSRFKACPPVAVNGSSKFKVQSSKLTARMLTQRRKDAK